MSKPKFRVGLLAILLLSMIVTGWLFSPTFYLNDDICIRSILSGAYTGVPDGHAVYMKYPLTFFISLLYRITGASVPWFSLLFDGLILLVIFLITDTTYDICKERDLPGSQTLWITGITLAVSAGLMLPQYLYMHYSLVTAIATCGGLFLWNRKDKRIWALVLLILAYQIRSQVFLLGIPFLAFLILWKTVGLWRSNSSELKAHLKKEGLWLALLAAGVLISVLCNTLAYRGTDWKAYLDYNEKRTNLYDYTDFLSTDRYQEYYEDFGLDKDQLYLLTSYNTILEHRPDTATIDKVATGVSAMQHSDQTFASYAKQTVLNYYNQIRYHNKTYSLLWFSLLGVTGLLILLQKKWLHLALLICLTGGRSLVWIYLIWKGRFPQRVSLSLYFIEIAALLAVLLTELPAIKKNTLRNLIGCAGLLCAVVFGGIHVKGAAFNVKGQLALQNQWNQLSSYCEQHSDTLYLLDVFSVVLYADTQYQADAPNMMLLGGWMTESPLVSERLQAYNAQDAAEVLTHSDVRLILRKGVDTERISSYLQHRYSDRSLQLIEWVDCGDDAVFGIYRLQ